MPRRRDRFARPHRGADPARFRARHLSLRRARVRSADSRSRSTAPTTCSTTIARCSRGRGQPAAFQRRLAARRAGHRRAGDLHRASSSPTGWCARSANWSAPPGASRRATSPTRVPVTRHRGRDPDAGHRLQPHDRAARRADRRAEGRQHPARDPPRVHRGGAVERHRGRGRARSDNRILLINRSAETLLERGAGSGRGRELAKVSPELDEFMRGDQREANVTVGRRRAASARWRSSACATRTARC